MANIAGTAGKPGAFYDGGGRFTVHRGKDLSALGRMIRLVTRTHTWIDFYNGINNEAQFGRAVEPFTEWSTKHREVCWRRDWIEVISHGISMDKIDDGLREARAEMVASRTELEKTVNDLAALQTTIEGRLVDHITTLRAARMSAVQEIALSTQALRDVRKFFMESDYHEEMRRLRDFVEVCERLKRLKDDGVLDAICDSALHLAVKP